MIRYKSEDKGLLQTLRTEVQQYMSETHSTKYADGYVKAKAALLLVLYILATVSIFLSGSLLQLYVSYILLGPLTVFIALNIAHEAAHNIFFKNKKLNQLKVESINGIHF